MFHRQRCDPLTPASSLYEGESVTLHCRHGDQRKEKNADFYKDKTLIEMDTNHQHTHEITISLMSDGSSYKCRFKDKESEIEYLKCEISYYV
ncbi:hypothetical protein FVA96_24145 [Escherichia coli]|nr:hypothetical protein [Escherichia coli]